MEAANSRKLGYDFNKGTIWHFWIEFEQLNLAVITKLASMSTPNKGTII